MSVRDSLPISSRSAATARSGPADLGRLRQRIGKFPRLGQLVVGFGDNLHVSKGLRKLNQPINII